MTEHVLLGLASIIILGIGAEWLAWRLRLPSILLLLVFGLVAGQSPASSTQMQCSAICCFQ